MKLWDSIVDLFTKRIWSRKFIAWVVSCVFLYIGKLPWEGWVVVTGVYVGADLWQQLKNGG